jgi:hypothetical protein
LKEQLSKKGKQRMMLTIINQGNLKARNKGVSFYILFFNSSLLTVLTTKSSEEAPQQKSTGLEKVKSKQRARKEKHDKAVSITAK